MKKILIGLVLITAFISCSDTDEVEHCGPPLIIDEDLFQSVDPDPGLFIIDHNLDDECLILTIGFSGCDPEHTIQLVTDGAVAESFPVQVQFKLNDLNPQLCEAYFEKEYAFDLDELDDLLDSEPKARMIFVQQGIEILWERE